MNYTFADFIGNIGVAIILGTYLMLQVERIDSKSAAYSIWNGIGSLLILFSLYYQFNLSAFIIEIAWLFISAFGLLQCWRRGRAAQG